MKQEVKDIINEMKQSDFIDLTYNIEELDGQEYVADVTSKVDDYMLAISKDKTYNLYVQDSNTGFCTHISTGASTLSELKHFLKDNNMSILFDVDMLNRINKPYEPPKRTFSRV
jgi:hypothetical protein